VRRHALVQAPTWRCQRTRLRGGVASPTIRSTKAQLDVGVPRDARVLVAHGRRIAVAGAGLFSSQ
jgi:glyoxylase-like metal-dependent hydrolase (beta-lactamase superfamily II)